MKNEFDLELGVQPRPVNGCLLLGLDSSTPIRITSPVLRTNPGLFNTVSPNPNFQSPKLCSFQHPAWMSRWKCW